MIRKSFKQEIDSTIEKLKTPAVCQQLYYLPRQNKTFLYLGGEGSPNSEKREIWSWRCIVNGEKDGNWDLRVELINNIRIISNSPSIIEKEQLIKEKLFGE